MTDDEEFYAWLDGELDTDAAARVEARVAGDPSLAALARQHRALGADLREAFTPVLNDAPPPPRFESADVIDFRSRREQRDARAGRKMPFATQWAAMAATLAIGIIAGTMISPESDGPVVRENGALVASASLEDALYARLASAPADDGVRIGLTFRDKSGNICRSFSEDQVSGLACQKDGDWQLRGLFQGGELPQGDYRMAAGGDPRLGALIDQQIAGEPFDAAAERAARQEGWR